MHKTYILLIVFVNRNWKWSYNYYDINLQKTPMQRFLEIAQTIHL